MADEWFPAPAIVKLNQEIQARWPGRDTTSDGVVGDTSHQARKSDHNPAWDEPEPFTGIVRATDRDDDGWPALEVQSFILDRCRSGKERRLAYLIHNWTIYSRTYGFEARPYDGDNPHETHIHFSLMHDMSNFDDSPWLSGFGQDGEEDDMFEESDRALLRTLALQEDGKYAVAPGQKTVGDAFPVMVAETQANHNDIVELKGQVETLTEKVDAIAAKLGV